MHTTPSGPHQCRRCAACVQASNSLAALARMVLRTMRVGIGAAASCSVRSAAMPAPRCSPAAGAPFPANVALQGLKVALPEPPVVDEPRLDRPQWGGGQGTLMHPAIDIAPPQPGIFQHPD